MTNKDQKQRYIRERNAGALPWELEKSERQGTESPMFSPDTPEKNPLYEGAKVQPLPQEFTPDPNYLEFLEKHHGIPPSFSLEQLPEFKLYWLETGEARKAWQSKFKNHVIYQWKRKQSETGKKSQRSTAEKLTDTSWADDDWFEQLDE